MTPYHSPSPHNLWPPHANSAPIHLCVCLFVLFCFAVRLSLSSIRVSLCTLVLSISPKCMSVSLSCLSVWITVSEIPSLPPSLDFPNLQHYISPVSAYPDLPLHHFPFPPTPLPNPLLHILPPSPLPCSLLYISRFISPLPYFLTSHTFNPRLPISQHRPHIYIHTLGSPPPSWYDNQWSLFVPHCRWSGQWQVHTPHSLLNLTYILVCIMCYCQCFLRRMFCGGVCTVLD